MTNYIVNSPQTLLTGTTGNDLFLLETGLAVSVYGIEGADTFTASAGANNFNQSILNGGAGNDTISLGQVGAGVASATRASFIGGGGTDLFSATFLATADRLLVQGGGDNDTINIDIQTASTAITVNGNGGVDLLSASVSAATNSLFALGGGDDIATAVSLAAANSSTLIGGGGKDIISASNIAGSSIVIAGDTDQVQSEFDGDDTIIINSATGLIAGLTQGNGGNDLITVTGLGAATTIGGNAGNDTITLAGLSAATRFELNAGAGNDVLSVGFSADNRDATINGGGGNDTITLSGLNASTITSFSFGDLGADKFNLQGTGFATANSVNFVAYASAGQSNLSAFDTISANGNGYSLSDLERNISLGVATSQGTNVVAADTGRVTFSNTFTLGVTARATAVDALGTTAGSTYYFSDGLGSDYVFVQGGASGTTDDLLVKNGTGAITSLGVAARGAGLLGGIINVTV